MKSIYLFPNKLKIPALVVFIISCILISLQFFESSLTGNLELNMKVFAIISNPFLDSENTGNFRWIENNMFEELIETLFFISGIILVFSKQKIEDEMIGLIRSKALTYTTYLIFTLLIISEFLIYGMAFGYVIMFFYYAFILFLNLFYYTKLYIYNKQFSYENED